MRFTCFLLLLLSFSAPAQTTFFNAYEPSLPYYSPFYGVNGIVQTADGGYVMGVSGTGIFWNDFIANDGLVKTDAQGNIVWAKYYDSIPFSLWGTTIQTYDGGFVVAGNGNGETIFKTDSLGNPVWAVNLGTISQNNMDVIQLPDSSLVCADGILLQFSASGAFLGAWTFMDPIGYEDEFSSLSNTSDGGYILASTTDSGGRVTKVDAQGNPTWAKSYSIGTTTNAPFGEFILEVANGGFLFGGGYKDQNGLHPYLICTDAFGNITWSKTYDQGTKFESAIAKPNGNFMLLGTVSGPSDFYGPSLLMEIDPLGAPLWNKEYPFSPWNYVWNQVPLKTRDFTRAQDGGYVIAAFDEDGFSGIIKTDSLGNTACSPGTISISTSAFPITVISYTATVQTLTQFPAPIITTATTIPVSIFPCGIGVGQEEQQPAFGSVFPNPATGAFTLTLAASTVPPGTQLTLFDARSRKAKSEAITQQSTTISTENLAPGLYLWQLTNADGTTATGKLLIE